MRSSSIEVREYRIIHLKNHEMHGKITWWLEIGHKLRYAEYKDGELHGKVINWSLNGQKWWEAEFKDGKRMS